MWQDPRENRFIGFDSREAPDFPDDELKKQRFSRSYGKKRSHREALHEVLEWLRARHIYLTGVVGAFPQLPAPGEEDAELAALLATEVAVAYYVK